MPERPPGGREEGGLAARVVLTRGSLRLDVALEAQPGQVLVVVGPNGAGKTTLLRALAGLLPLEAGGIHLAGRILDDPAEGIRTPPQQRRAGVVFQDYRLFPHLSVRENIAFGLRAGGASRRDASEVAQHRLAEVGLAGLGGMRPGDLSGGQAQRVALARALAADPAVLLLDEPLAALDAGTRGGIRSMLARRLRAFAGVSILVTHDPLDALVLADRILVLEAGRVVQADVPAALAARPRSSYVARLMGLNLLAGLARPGAVMLTGGRTLVTTAERHGPVLVALRPSAVAVHRERPAGSPRNAWAGRIDSVEATGGAVRVRVDAEPPLLADVTSGAVAELGLVPGVAVWVAVKATDLDVYASDDEEGRADSS